MGPRSCLGQWFALLEARVVLALLVKVCTVGVDMLRCLVLVSTSVHLWRVHHLVSPGCTTPLSQRFKFEPLVKNVKRHPSVIPLGPDGGMPMRIG